MKTVTLIGVLVLLTGCAGLIQMDTVADAYRSYERQRYERTLKLISQAEAVRETHPELRAELTYLKAQTYEAMGDAETATTLYEYLRDRHQDSQYGYLAAKRLGGHDAPSS